MVLFFYPESNGIFFQLLYTIKVKSMKHKKNKNTKIPPYQPSRLFKNLKHQIFEGKSFFLLLNLIITSTISIDKRLSFFFAWIMQLHDIFLAIQGGYCIALNHRGDLIDKTLEIGAGRSGVRIPGRGKCSLITIPVDAR